MTGAAGVARWRRTSECRLCGNAALTPVLDLGRTPLANSLLGPDSRAPAPTYPLTLVRCRACALVQIGEIVDAEDLFSEYVYFSSFSDTMLRHSRALVDHLVAAEGLGESSLAVEVASNDGYLLQYFGAHRVPVLGIEPAANIARVAESEKGIPTVARFFGSALADELVRGGTKASVLIGNNVLAHVPDLNDFARGVGTLLSDHGVAVFEFPYLKDMLDGIEFDTIYHEHQCYFSLSAVSALFERHALAVVDVERIPIHGGSLRTYLAHRGAPGRRRRRFPRCAAKSKRGV
jgi:hypothetical protein